MSDAATNAGSLVNPLTCFVWSRDGHITRFEFCYDKLRDEHVLEWGANWVTGMHGLMMVNKIYCASKHPFM